MECHEARGPHAQLEYAGLVHPAVGGSLLGPLLFAAMPCLYSSQDDIVSMQDGRCGLREGYLGACRCIHPFLQFSPLLQCNGVPRCATVLRVCFASQEQQIHSDPGGGGVSGRGRPLPGRRAAAVGISALRPSRRACMTARRLALAALPASAGTSMAAGCSRHLETLDPADAVCHVAFLCGAILHCHRQALHVGLDAGQ